VQVQGGAVQKVQKALPPVPALQPPAVQPVPLVQPPPPVMNPPVLRRVPLRPVSPLGQLNLVAGKRAAVPTSIPGAIRVRALPALPQNPGYIAQQVPAKRAGESIFFLEVTPEPRVQNFSLLPGSNVHLDKVVDDQGQTLSVAAEPEFFQNQFNG